MGQDGEKGQDQAITDARQIPWEKGGGKMPGRDKEPAADAGIAGGGDPYEAVPADVVFQGDYQPGDEGDEGDEERPTNVFDGQSIAGYPAPTDAELPDWVQVPKGFVIPPGVVLGFLRFRAEWTAAAHKGDRQCILWPLTDNDERVAFTRIRHLDAHATSILAQHQIRAIDGHKVDWDTRHLDKPGSVYSFWRDIGPKCRSLIVRWYHQNHMLDVGETADFFANCVAVVTAAPSTGS